ncbi:MAG: hypothetical protein ABIS92_17070 [Polyangia bacterium]
MVVEHGLRGSLGEWVLSLAMTGGGLAGGVLGASGCGGHVQSSRQATDGMREVRSSIAVGDSEPRMLLAGPARLLHVQVEKRKGVVAVFRAPRQEGTNADCRMPVWREEVRSTGKGGAIDVARDEVVCAQVARKARLSWHVLAFSAPENWSPPLVRHASLP